MDFLGGVLVTVLFVVYLALWKIKQISQIKETGIDPEVLVISSSNLQRFMGIIFKILTVCIILCIVLHAGNFKFYSFFDRFDFIDIKFVKIIGFLTGLSGLSLCLYSQIIMGQSWRVGIDESKKTDLIQTGPYKIIRNPTYLGLFVLNLGVWLIWPTWTIFLFNLLFVYALEIQVRCEEDFLEKNHGELYIKYKKSTKRYIPFIY